MKKIAHVNLTNIRFVKSKQDLQTKINLSNFTECIFRNNTIWSLLILMLLSTSGFAQNWDQIIKTSASDRAWRYQPDRAIDDYFGASVAIDGNYAIVGAYKQEDVGGTTPFQGGTALLFKKNASGQWLFLKKLKSDDLAGDDNFGYSVAINGNTIVVGAWNEYDVAPGAGQFGAGAAYVFSKDQGGTDNWGQVKKIVASDRTAGDQFGTSVSISGSYIVVGAPKEAEDASGGATAAEAGSAYVFYKDQGGTDNWGEVKKIVASDRYASDQFGRSVSISGTNIVVGAWWQDQDANGVFSPPDAQQGAAYVFSKDAGGTDTWGQVKKLLPPDRAGDDYFGFSVAISGNNIVVGAYQKHEPVVVFGPGAVYMYNKDQGGTDNWGLIKKIVPADGAANDHFGYSVAINGNTLVVGAKEEDHDALGGAQLFAAGSTYVFSKDNGGADNWGQVKKLVASDRAASDFLGWSVSISGTDIISGAWAEDEDDEGINTLSAAGAAYTYNLNQGGAGNWGQVNKLVAKSLLGNQNYGVSISIDGDYAVIGAYGEDKDAAGLTSLINAGAVYVLKKQAGVWTEVKKLVASDRAAGDYFGISVFISGNNIVVGAQFESEDAAGGATLTQAGSAYVFSKDAGGTDNWGQVKKLVPSDRAASDRFGCSVSISGTNIVIGANQEDEDAAGSNTLSAAGSAYVFSKDAGGTDNWGQVKKLVASDRAAGDNFATSVAISENIIVIGAPSEDEDASGGATLTSSGAAYVFSKDLGGVNNWGQVQKIVASDRAASDVFGNKVAINGNTVVVGAQLEDEDASGGATLTSSGAAYVFSKDAGGADNWGQVKKLVATIRAANDYFGSSVTVSGNNIVVGAIGESEDASEAATLLSAGAAYVFNKDQGGANNWGQVQKIVASDRAASDLFANSVAISGGNILVGASSEDEDAAGTNNITSSGSVYYFENASYLPLTWGSFTVEKQQNNVLLKWSTLQEQNTHHFIVQHSANGTTWIDISQVQAVGNSQVLQRYKYTHTKPISGLNYYRLLQVDIDGNATFSSTVKLMLSSINVFKLYPNPVQQGQVNVTLSKAATVNLYNQVGVLLLSRVLPAGNSVLYVQQLPKGVYLLKSGSQQLPFIIQ